MTWHYVASHRKLPDGTDWYEVREVYEGLSEDDHLGWTEEAIAPAGETLEELTAVLDYMLSDIQRFPVLEVDS